MRGGTIIQGLSAGAKIKFEPNDTNLNLDIRALYITKRFQQNNYILSTLHEEINADNKLRAFVWYRSP